MTEAPAKPAKRGRPKASDAPAVDFSALTFEEAEPIKRQSGPNPFHAPLAHSYEYDKARVTAVPAAAVSRAEAMIRRAADELGIGVSIQKTDPDSEGNVRVTFQGKERRKRKSKSDAAETPAVTPPAETATDQLPAAMAPGEPSVPAGEPVTASAAATA